MKNCLRHEKPFSFNQYVSPVPLATSCAPPGTMCTVNGWGNTMSYYDDSDKLQALNKPILSTRDCENSYPGMIDTETMLCAGYLEGGKGTAIALRIMTK